MRYFDGGFQYALKFFTRMLWHRHLKVVGNDEENQAVLRRVLCFRKLALFLF